MEAFALLRREETDDGAGGTAVRYGEECVFRAGVTAAGGALESFAGGAALKTRTALLHDRSVRLRPRMLVKRLRDGAVYRVTGDSADMETPARMRPAFAQVPVELVREMEVTADAPGA